MHPDTGELVRVAGRLVRIDGPEAMAQGVRVRWRTWRGELFLRPDLGVIYDLLLQKGTPQQRIEQELESQALTVPGVIALEFGDVTQEDRRIVVPVAIQGSVDDQRRRVTLDSRIDLPIG